MAASERNHGKACRTMPTDDRAGKQPGIVRRWAANSVAPANYWGERYEDAIYEWGEGFFAGFMVALGVCFVLVLVTGWFM